MQSLRPAKPVAVDGAGLADMPKGEKLPPLQPANPTVKTESGSSAVEHRRRRPDNCTARVTGLTRGNQQAFKRRQAAVEVLGHAPTQFCCSLATNPCSSSAQAVRPH